MCNINGKNSNQKYSFTHVVEKIMHNFFKTLNIVFIKKIFVNSRWIDLIFEDIFRFR